NKSFAKLNLYLEVTGINQQGYHLLDSLMSLINLYDIIKIEESSKLELAIDGAYSKHLKANINENIIIKAVNLLAKNYNLNPKFKISLTKNIPVSAGLCGGSSNAATIILMFNQIYNLNLPIERLTEIGLQLGCDVPFFLHQKTALISGIGEKITEVK